VTGSSLVQAVLLLIGLRGKLPSLRLREIGFSAARTLLAAAAAVVVGRLMAGWIAASSLARDQSALGRALPGAVAAASFAAAFLLLSWGLRSDELLLVAGPVLRRLRKNPAA
jgi:hypothetical protein